MPLLRAPLLLLTLGQAAGLVFIESGQQSVALRSPTQAVTFTRQPDDEGEYVLSATQVRSASGGGDWLTVFDVPTPIVAGSAAWDLRPAAVVVTRNDSAAACVNFTRGNSKGAGTRDSFWIGACLDGASGGLVSFSANLLVSNATVIGPGPEPQLMLRRHANASEALDQGPLSIYHNPVVATQGESSNACGAGVGAGALGHGLGFPAAHARWDATPEEATVSGGGEVEAAIYFNMTASTWFSHTGHGRFGSAWIRSTNGSLGFVTECLYGPTIAPGPAKIQWYLKQRAVPHSPAAAAVVASRKLRGLDWAMRAFAPLHPAIPARETLAVPTRASPYVSSWQAYVNQTTRQLLVLNVTVAESYPSFEFTDWPLPLAAPFSGMLAHFSRPAYDSHGDAAAHDWSCVNNHLAPWLLWRRLQPQEVDPAMSETLDRKIRQLPAFYDNISNLIRYDVTFGRNKDQEGSWTTRSSMPDGLSMTWQNFFFHSETLRIADVQPTADFLPQTHGRVIMATQALIECAHAQQYAFGQFFDPVGRHAAQQRDQPALGVVREPWQVGTYALVLLRAHELTGNITLLAEAEASFEALFNGSMAYTLERDTNSSGLIGPHDQFVNETISDTADFPITEIEGNGYGVIAAIQLAALTGDTAKYATYMRHFVNSLLRDTPWGSDRTDDTARSFDGAGLFAPYVGGLPSLPWESNIAQAGIAAALGASASGAGLLPPETRTLLLKISNLHRLNGMSWYPAGYTAQQRALYNLPGLTNRSSGYLEYIPIETMYGFENGVGSAGQASYMACHAMWMWWLHEALAVASDTEAMVMNTVVWGRGLEPAVRGLRREFAVFATGSSSRSQTVMVRMLALREGAVYNVSTLTGSIECTAARLAIGVAVPVDRGGEGTLVVELLRGRTGGVAAVAAEAATLRAAEAAQGALASAYAALQSAPLGASGEPGPQVHSEG